MTDEELASPMYKTRMFARQLSDVSNEANAAYSRAVIAVHHAWIDFDRTGNMDHRFILEDAREVASECKKNKSEANHKMLQAVANAVHERDIHYKPKYKGQE